MNTANILPYIKKQAKPDSNVCQFVRDCYNRHLADLENKNSDHKFVASEARNAIVFISTLRHTKGALAGKRINLEMWQKALLYILFGWRNNDDGRRRFHRAYVEVARKNGKTTLAAGILLYCWMCEGEGGAEAYCIATKKEQAAIAYKEVVAQVNRHELIKEKCKVLQYNIIKNGDSMAVCRALSADSKTEDGLNPSFILCDEYHAHPTSDLLSVMETGTGSRASPLTFIITTAGKNLSSPCYEERQNITDINAGAITAERTFGIIYTLDKGDDWASPKVWSKANPNIGKSVITENLEKGYENAVNKPSTEVEFKTKNLNMWTQAAEVWIPTHVWDGLQGEIPYADLEGLDAFVAIDMSSTKDFTAICVAVPHYDKVYLLWDLLLPATDLIARGRADRVPYPAWAEAGYISHAGDVVDYRDVEKIIREYGERYNITKICYDPHFCTPLINEIGSDFNTRSIKQSYTGLTTYTAAFEEGIYSGKIIHDGNPCVRWHMQCAVLRQNDEQKMITKPSRNKSTTRVDAIATAIMAYGSATLDIDTFIDEDYSIGVL